MLTVDLQLVTKYGCSAALVYAFVEQWKNGDAISMPPQKIAEIVGLSHPTVIKKLRLLDEIGMIKATPFLKQGSHSVHKFEVVKCANT